MDENKYRGYNENDTFWDDYHRKNGVMTNREFFSSNSEGGFYEGMEWDEDDGEWIPNAENRRIQAAEDAEREERECHICGIDKDDCWC